MKKINLFFKIVIMSVVLLFSNCTKDNIIKSSSIEKIDENLTITDDNDHICTEMHLDDYTIHSKSSSAKLAIVKSKFWGHEETITVSFIGGTNFVQEKVIQFAKEWEIYANIKFDFITSGTGDIRISFDESSGS